MRRVALIAAMAAAPGVLSAQQWTAVGKTREGTEIFVSPKSIKRGGDTVTVQILARYVPANFYREGSDTVRAVTTVATFDCAKEKVKVTETAFFANFDRNRVVKRSKPKVPGYQAVFGGSMPQVYAYVCPRKKK
jgi:hypothetical protein